MVWHLVVVTIKNLDTLFAKLFFLVINPPGKVVKIVRENSVNTMATDALAPYVARSSVAMVLTMRISVPLPCTKKDYGKMLGVEKWEKMHKFLLRKMYVAHQGLMILKTCGQMTLF